VWNQRGKRTYSKMVLDKNTDFEFEDDDGEKVNIVKDRRRLLLGRERHLRLLPPVVLPMALNKAASVANGRNISPLHERSNCNSWVVGTRKESFTHPLVT
jgi:hypothetical protein